MNKKYPLVNDLKKRAKKRIPKFAFEYLEGGCNEEINLSKNKSDLNKSTLYKKIFWPLFVNKNF